MATKTKTSRIEWVGSWNDATESVRQLARDLKDYGIKARTTDSIYMGMRRLQVAKADVAKAKRVLKKDLFGENNKYIADECLN